MKTVREKLIEDRSKIVTVEGFSLSMHLQLYLLLCVYKTRLSFKAGRAQAKLPASTIMSVTNKKKTRLPPQGRLVQRPSTRFVRHWCDSPPVVSSCPARSGLFLRVLVGEASSSWLGVVPSGKLTGRELVAELDGRELAQFCRK